MNTTLYPPNPKEVDPAITRPGIEYKSEVGKVMATIILFFAVYLLLIVLSVMLAIGCVYLGVAIMFSLGHWIGILAGLGIISIGIMVVIFLVKFIFSVRKVDESKMMEITAGEQPQLFAFIRQLTNDTQTRFPKKIFLTADVNAAVFYNDSFWSMFFPVPKNLKIGLGLVNSLTVSEFKAVMAHEFGHFSQRSMKLGSFVYNVNKVIYNMLYENKDYGKFLSGWGNVHAVISIFVWITVQLVKGIQKILELMYAVVNKGYMRLSREMEFHADAVAASVSGANNCITALENIELCDLCFSTVLQKADQYLQQKQVLGNVYTRHDFIMRRYAMEYDLPMKNNVPVATEDFLKRFQFSKINVEDQWASHPTMTDRIRRLKQLQVEAPPNNDPAWKLFNDPAALQEKLTAVLYNHLPGNLRESAVAEDEFEARYLSDAATYTLPEFYNGYYDGRQMNDMDVKTVFNRSVEAVPGYATLQQRYSDEKVARLKSFAALQSDAAILENIIKGGMEVKSFDYDGKKYKRSEAAALLQQLKEETELLQKQLQEEEEMNAGLFYQVATRAGAGQELKEMYLAHFSNRKSVLTFTGLYEKVYSILAPLMQGQTVSIEKATAMAGELCETTDEIKPLLWQFIRQEIIVENAEVESLKQFLRADQRYFFGNSFSDGDLSSLQNALRITLETAGDFQFKKFKALLEYQLWLLDQPVAQPHATGVQ